MPYDKEKLFEKAKKVIEKKNIFFIEDLAAFLPCTKSTLYNLFKTGMPEMDTLKELMWVNRVKQKHSIKERWNDSGNVSAEAMLYKLIGTSDERKKLSQTHHDLTTSGEKITAPTIIVQSQETADELEKLTKKQD